MAFGGALGVALVFLSLLAVKDMNDKLGVMTASNAGYQKMTDSQAEKIRSLSQELEALRASKVSELKTSEDEKDALETRINSLEEQTRTLQKEVDDYADMKSQLEHEKDELKRMMGRQKQDSEEVSIQLRDQIAKISIQRDTCQKQYDALFKLQQEASDNMANLAHDKERLQLQLTDATQRPPVIPSQNHQIYQQQQLQQQNFVKSSTMQQVGLEQPHQILQQIPQSSSTSKHGAGQGSSINSAPVGAQPPIFNQHPPEVVPLHQIKKEDVMEAPKVVHFENMDAQVDPIQHNHPGLQAPIYREAADSHHELVLDEDDLEDNADGQIPNDYHENKAANQRYDHLNDIDYDFQADFQPNRVIAKPRQTFQRQQYQPKQHQPLIVQDQRFRPHHNAQLAAQIQKQHPQFIYRRGGGL